MKYIHITMTALLLLIITLKITSSTGAQDTSKPIDQSTAQKLLLSAREAYSLQMDANVITNRDRRVSIIEQMKKYFSEQTHGSILNESELAPLGLQPGVTEDQQRETIEKLLEEKNISKDKVVQYQKLEQDIMQSRKQGAFIRIQKLLDDSSKSFEADNTTMTGWGLDDFKLLKADEITTVSGEKVFRITVYMQVWSRFAYTPPNSDQIVSEPHNGLNYTFYFQEEGDNWKIMDWKFEFLPDQGPTSDDTSSVNYSVYIPMLERN